MLAVGYKAVTCRQLLAGKVAAAVAIAIAVAATVGIIVVIIVVIIVFVVFVFVVAVDVVVVVVVNLIVVVAVIVVVIVVVVGVVGVGSNNNAMLVVDDVVAVIVVVFIVVVIVEQVWVNFLFAMFMLFMLFGLSLLLSFLLLKGPDSQRRDKRTFSKEQPCRRSTVPQCMFRVMRVQDSPKTPQHRNSCKTRDTQGTSSTPHPTCPPPVISPIAPHRAALSSHVQLIRTRRMNKVAQLPMVNVHRALCRGVR